jgi:hypothetical protein
MSDDKKRTAIWAELIRMAKAIPTFAQDFSDSDRVTVWINNLEKIPTEQLRNGFDRAPISFSTFPSLKDFLALVLDVPVGKEECKKKSLEIAERVWSQGTMSRNHKMELSVVEKEVLDTMGGAYQFQQYLEKDHDFVIKRAADISHGILIAKGKEVMTNGGNMQNLLAPGGGVASVPPPLLPTRCEPQNGENRGGNPAPGSARGACTMRELLAACGMRPRGEVPDGNQPD